MVRSIFSLAQQQRQNTLAALTGAWAGAVG
jgi:hypothetical protein